MFEQSNRAKQYATRTYIFVIVSTLYQGALSLIFLYSGGSAWLARYLNNVFGTSGLALSAFILIFFAGAYLLQFPLVFYQSFVQEHTFALSKQTLGDWILDQVKSGILLYVFFVILASVFYWMIGHYHSSWWLFVSLFWIVFSLLLARLAPIILIPLFFKYKAVSDSALKARIIKLAERMRIAILDVFEINFSKKTLKANAALVGWGKTRRILLADTLQTHYTHDEIEVILAHEFAHYRQKHLLKLLLMHALVVVGSCYLMYVTNSKVLEFFRIGSLSDLASFPVVLLYGMVIGVVLTPLENLQSRRFEIEADRVAVKETGLQNAFVSLMEKLASQNLADRNPHPLIKLFFFDHPPIDERIALALKDDIGELVNSR
ncbi:MAG: M48 family metallopeptidase [Candidatus Omnitrophica bacterium]|nr:M48 family metallopeptidase [Candidatus Omnitrophota bacterium]